MAQGPVFQANPACVLPHPGDHDGGTTCRGVIEGVLHGLLGHVVVLGLSQNLVGGTSVDDVGVGLVDPWRVFFELGVSATEHQGCNGESLYKPHGDPEA